MIWRPDLATTLEIAFVSEFHCRHCGTALVGRSRAWSSWMRCPQCGRASLAPEIRIEPSPRFVPLPDDPPDDLLVIGPDPELSAMTPLAAAGPSEISGEDEDDLGLITAVSVRRVVASTILFLSLTMLVLSVLDQSSLGSSLFGTIAMVAIVLLVWPSPSSRRS